MKLSFIGGGNMGEAMISRIIEQKLGARENILVSDVNGTRREYLGKTYRINTTENNAKAAAAGEVVVLAIKPQNLTPVLAGLKGHLKPEQLVLSIIAGATVNILRGGLDHAAIVRAMPNTPAQVGVGMTVWTAAAEVNERQKEWAKAILGCIGQEIYVGDEKYLDMATAVSGSGPAYFFLFAEALADAAVSVGVPRDMAEKLATQTLFGSGTLLKKAGKPAAELRRMVTSPGGTTAEAVACFEASGFHEIMRRAVVAAYEKAKQLGGQR